MRFEKTFPLQDGRTLRIRNAEPADAQPLLDLIVLTHSQTDYLQAYPDERRFTPEQEAANRRELEQQLYDVFRKYADKRRAKEAGA